MEHQVNQLTFTLTNMGLNEYQASALSHLIYLGETKATTLSKASGVPTARIYGVLDELSQKGLVVIRPGRPALYSPLNPDEIADALVSASRLDIRKQLDIIEGFRDGFEQIATDLFKKAGNIEKRTGLIRIISVGEASLDETRRMYQTSNKSLRISTRAMEYLGKVEDDLRAAVEKGVRVKVLLRKPETLKPSDARIQEENTLLLREILGDNGEIKFSSEVEIRGVVSDYEAGGRVLFLVEEEGIPFYLREAALTTHPGVVKAFGAMFDLKWKFDAE